MILRHLTLEECEAARQWRNATDVLPMLRTGYKTEAEQAAFYRDVVNNPESDHRYYALERDGQFVGMGGLTYLRRTPGEAEISLILGPDFRGKGLGHASVEALLMEAQRLGLTAVVGECLPTGNLGFWAREIIVSPRAVDFEYHGESLTWRWTL